MPHTAYTYQMTVVVEEDELSDEQEATLRTRLRDLGNNAASGVELTMELAQVPVTVTGTMTVEPA